MSKENWMIILGWIGVVVGTVQTAHGEAMDVSPDRAVKPSLGSVRHRTVIQTPGASPWSSGLSPTARQAPLSGSFPYTQAGFGGGWTGTAGMAGFPATPTAQFGNAFGGAPGMSLGTGAVAGGNPSFQFGAGATPGYQFGAAGTPNFQFGAGGTPGFQFGASGTPNYQFGAGNTPFGNSLGGWGQQGAFPNAASSFGYPSWSRPNQWGYQGNQGLWGQSAAVSSPYQQGVAPGGAFYSQYYSSALGSAPVQPRPPWNAPGTMLGGPQVSPQGPWSSQLNHGQFPSAFPPAARTRPASPSVQVRNAHDSHAHPHANRPPNWAHHSPLVAEQNDAAEALVNRQNPRSISPPDWREVVAEQEPSESSSDPNRDDGARITMRSGQDSTPHTIQTSPTPVTDDPDALNPNIVFGGPVSLTFPEIPRPETKTKTNSNSTSLSPNSIRIGEILSFPRGTDFSAVPPQMAAIKKSIQIGRQIQRNDYYASPDYITFDKGQQKKQLRKETNAGTTANGTTTMAPGENSDQIRSAQKTGKTKAGSVMENVMRQIRQSKVVLYGPVNCTVCEELEDLLKNYTVSVRYIRLESNKKGGQISMAVQQLVHSSEMPLVFICGRFVGGYQRILDLHANQKIKPLLRECTQARQRAIVLPVNKLK